MKSINSLIFRSLLYNNVKIVTNFGNFDLNALYDLNEYAIDGTNIIFKCLVEIRIYNKNTEKIDLDSRYLVLSDSMLLIFVPDQTKKNFGKLIFFGNIAHIEYLNLLDMEKETDKLLKARDKKLHSNIISKDSNTSNNNKYSSKTYLRFKIHWKESDIYLGEISRYYSILIVEFDAFGILDEKIKEKRKALINTSELFSEDYMKFISPDSINSFDETKLVELVMYHENLFIKAIEKDKSASQLASQETQMFLKEQAKEIVFLYQKIIEILSIRNDNNYNIYLSKMQNFLEAARPYLDEIWNNTAIQLDSSYNYSIENIDK